MKNKLFTLVLALFASVGSLCAANTIETTVNATVGESFVIYPWNQVGSNSYYSDYYGYQCISMSYKAENTSALSVSESQTVSTAVGYYKTYRVTPLQEGNHLLYIYAPCSKTTSGGTHTMTITILYHIVVSPKPVVTSISIPSNLTLSIGESYTFNPVIYETGATTTLTWQSSNTSCVSIKNGKITAIAPGSSRITCTADNGVKAYCDVNVSSVMVSSISFDKEELELSEGERYTLLATILPDNATNKTLMWASSNEDVAFVSSKGVVIGVGKGYCNITATANDGSNVSESCLVHVKNTIQQYTISVSSIDENMGTVSGSGTYDEGSIINISANPTTGYHFVQWSDGNTDNPRTLTATKDITLTATFELDKCLIASGTCGAEGDSTNLRWELSCDSVLTICGTGAMADYEGINLTVWFKYRKAVKSIRIQEGVTSIGRSCLSDFNLVDSIFIPKTITHIAIGAIYCENLKSIIVDSLNQYYDSRDNCNAIIETATNKLIKGCDNTTIPESVVTIGKYALECIHSSTIEIPESVTRIETGAFAGSGMMGDGLISIIIPNSVTYLGDSIFTMCYHLEHVTLSNNITRIGECTFSECESLHNIIIPEGVTEIGLEAFALCDSFDSIVIPNSVRIIGESAFIRCNRLKSVTLSNTLDSIGLAAFEDCISLSAITIPSSVRVIDKGAFYNCQSLTSVTFDNSIPPIIHNAKYDGCFSYTPCVINVPCGSKELYLAALNKGISENDTIASSRVVEQMRTTYSVLSADATLGIVTILNEPSCIEGLSFRADPAEGYQFKQWSDGSTDNPRTIELTQDTTLTAEFELAKCILASGTCGAQGDNLTWELSCDSVLTISGEGEMADYWFDTTPWSTRRESILAIIIEDSVTTIGKNAFTAFSNLLSVTIPNSVTSIGEDAFSDCIGLTSIIIPNSVIIIEDGAFGACSNLTNVMIGNSVVTIGEGAFFECSSLTNVIIPNSVTSVGKFAFSDCTGLMSVTIGDNVTTIGNEAFANCPALTNIVIPHSVKTIGNEAFIGCSALTSVTIPNSVTSVGISVFANCFNLTSMIVEDGNTMYDCRDNCNAIIETSSNTLIIGCKSTTIPNSVTNIGENAFYLCSKLTSVTIPDAVVNIGGDAFYGCSSLTSLIIPDSVISIGRYAFAYCYGLTSATIGNSVTTIGECAFMDCYSLTNLIIPNSVTTIVHGAFYGCSALTSIECEALTPPTLERNAFKKVDHSIPLYVPAESVEVYMAAEGWSEFTNIQPIKCLLASGYCGAEGDSTNLVWELSCDSVLTISGTGWMKDYTYTDIAPWYNYGQFIASVIITDGVKSIGTKAFYKNYPNLYSVNLGNNIDSIGNCAFFGCSALRAINIPNCVTKIGHSVFSTCTNLTNVNIGEGVVSIGGCAFLFCKMSEIVLPQSLVTLGDEVFGGCDRLSSFTLPKSVTSIGHSLVTCCSNLQSIIVEEGNSRYDSRDNCNAIIETATNTIMSTCRNSIIPNSITCIGYGAFSSCRDTWLTSMVLPDNVTSIEDFAFSGCRGLKSITIPANVHSIGMSVFMDCDSLNTIEFKGSTPPQINNNNRGCFATFSNVIKDFYVPCGSKDAYWEMLNNHILDTISLDHIYERMMQVYSVIPANTEQGSVTVLQEPTFCDNLTLSFRAVPKEFYVFDYWTNGIDKFYDQQLNVTLTQDTAFVAHFKPWTVDVVFMVENDNTNSGGEQFYYLNDVPVVYDEELESGHYTIELSDEQLLAARIALNNSSWSSCQEGEYSFEVMDWLVNVDNWNDWSNDLSPILQLSDKDYASYSLVGDEYRYNPYVVTINAQTQRLYRHVDFATNDNSRGYVTATYGAETISSNEEYAHELSVACGETATLVAISNPGYQFKHFAIEFSALAGDVNYSTSNPLYVTIEDTKLAKDHFYIYTAIFEPIFHTVAMNVNDDMMGFVEGAGQYLENAQALIHAEPYETYRFIGWYVDETLISDNADLAINVVGDTTLNAVFEPIPMSANLAMIYINGTPVENYASDNYNYTLHYPAGTDESELPTRKNVTFDKGDAYQKVVKSQNGTTIMLNVTSGRGLTKVYMINCVIEVPNQYALTALSSNEEWGYVIGDGSYDEGATATIQAIPYDGYQFYNWNNSITENPYSFTLTQDTSFIALFLPDDSEEVITAVGTNSILFEWERKPYAWGYWLYVYLDCRHEIWLCRVKLVGVFPLVLPVDFEWGPGYKLSYIAKVGKEQEEMRMQMRIRKSTAEDIVSYTLENLASGTEHFFTIEAFDEVEEVVDVQAGSCTTKSVQVPTQYEEIESEQELKPYKIFRNGQIYIQRGDKIYTIHGQEVK